MSQIIGTTGPAVVASPIKIKSVMVSTDGGIGTLNLADYNDPNSTAKLWISTLADTTTQVLFDGIPFPGGITVTPSGAAASYVVEYEPL